MKETRRLPSIRINPNFKTSDDVIWKTVCNMKHADLVKACILKGMAFELVLKFDHNGLLNWYYKNFDNTEVSNPELTLKFYDDWYDEQLIKDGFSPRHPNLRLGYVEPIQNGDITESPNTIKKDSINKESKPKAIKQEVSEKKVKHEEWGINTGTKKYLTYQLCIEQNLSMEDTVVKVLESYPEAEAKSVQIWWKRAKAFKK